MPFRGTKCRHKRQASHVGPRGQRSPGSVHPPAAARPPPPHTPRPRCRTADTCVTSAGPPEMALLDTNCSPLPAEPVLASGGRLLFENGPKVERPQGRLPDFSPQRPQLCCPPSAAPVRGAPALLLWEPSLWARDEAASSAESPG